MGKEVEDAQEAREGGKERAKQERKKNNLRVEE